MKIFVKFVFFWALLTVCTVNSQSDLFSKTRILVQNSQWEDVIKALDKEPTKNAQDKELYMFQKAYSFFELNNYDSARALFTDLQKNKNVFDDYSLYF
ncbi:MAG: hypothetical protein KDD45_03520, partial [Bdellovibrionales bacterium]|nr:hypothetical protein [Bdellovibrionales bacterium]